MNWKVSFHIKSFSSIALLFTTFALMTQKSFSLNCDIQVRRENSLPRVENTRTHERIQDSTFAGITFKIRANLPKEPEVYIPSKWKKSRKIDLLIHFHGNPQAVKYAAREFNASIAAVSINFEESSVSYSEAFRDPSRFHDLLRTIANSIERQLKRPIQIRRIFLSSFGEGYDAVRQIISIKSNLPKLYAVLLLDGIYANYVPDRTMPGYEQVDSTELQPITDLAFQAANPDSNIKLLITHSEIFPGVFAGTTECTDYIIRHVGVKRSSKMKRGPLGMQQLSRARLNHLEILGFAGNTLPDHMDHLEALYHFLKVTVRL